MAQNLCLEHSFRIERSVVSSKMDFDCDPPERVISVEQFFVYCRKCGYSYTVDRKSAEFESHCRAQENETD
jgi:hypothetical protein